MVEVPRRQKFSRSWFVLAGWVAATWAVLLPCSNASADDSVVVLGISSVEGDDEVARNLTGTIRNAASRVRGWHLLDSEVTLAQMSLAHGCSDEPDTTCLAQVAQALGADRVVYGIVRRERGDFMLTASIYVVRSNAIEHTVRQAIPRSRADVDDLRAMARTLAAELSAPLTGSLRVVTDAPGANVVLDGTHAGVADDNGMFMVSQVTEGTHRVEVNAPGRSPAEGTVEITRDEEARFDAALPVSEAPPSSGSSGGPNWAAVSLFTIGAVAFGASIGPMARIVAIQSEQDWVDYKGPWPENDPDICAHAANDDVRPGFTEMMADRIPGRVYDLCVEGATLEIVQFVLIGVAAATAGTAAVLWILDAVQGSESRDEERAFLLVPSANPEGGRLDLHVRF